jgi:methyl-CpG-binding domain protein 4
LRTPGEFSPLCLIQEFLRDEPWRLLVACVMLNQTSAKQVWPVARDFFQLCPTPRTVTFTSEEEIVGVLRPLGLQNRRVRTIMRLSREWCDKGYGPFFGGRPKGDSVIGLPGIGKYASDSYRMFVDPGEIVEDVRDKELRKYVAWAKERKDAGR